MKIQITKKNAKHLLLAYHELVNPRSLRNDNDSLKFIKKVGCIQYDPLNIVGKNPDLVMQSRVHNYNESFLTKLLYETQDLIDGWDKNMSIFPFQDWPYLQRYSDYYTSYLQTKEFKKNYSGYNK